MKGKVLFIDDDPGLQKVFKMILAGEYNFVSAFTGAQGLERLEKENPDVVLLDINLPDKDGITVLKEINARISPPPVIMVTALGETRLIVDAIRGGACNYIIKSEDPDFEEVKNSIWQALQNRSVQGPSRETEEALKDMLGESREMQQVKEQISLFAGSVSPVLILGESGTGKELAARGIHLASHRREQPFLAVNCGAIPPTLMETTLFGSEKGAFTGALSSPGYFEKADKGTIFLDELGELPLEGQVKLLRVLETGEVERVGGRKSFKVNVRVVGATNRDLKEEMNAGRFRKDLFYRLTVLPIHLPPLRERLEDIPLLGAHLLSVMGGEKRLSPGALEKLNNHTWPGNIRELKNVLERGRLLSREEEFIKEEHIQFF